MKRSERSPAYRYAAVLAAGVLCASLTGCGAAGDTDAGADAGRQSRVAEEGRKVMPFDLERTTHRFVKTGTGGVQTVVADDPADTRQIGLVQQHLRSEAERFTRGDFSDPARIHGDGMPGLAALRSSAGRIAIEYATTSDGGRITFSTSEPALVSALHAWFDAQVSDHGGHATHG